MTPIRSWFDILRYLGAGLTTNGAIHRMDEVGVMEIERRGCVDRVYDVVNQFMGGTAE